MMEAGVSRRRSMGLVISTPITMVASEAIAASVTQLPMDSLSLSRFPAP